jgi:hypothetical protein
LRLVSEIVSGMNIHYSAPGTQRASVVSTPTDRRARQFNDKRGNGDVRTNVRA